MTISLESIPRSTLSSPHYLERARAVAPLVEANAAEGEAAGAMPEAAVAALKEAELFWMLVDADLGGGGLSIDAALEVMGVISEADGSTGRGGLDEDSIDSYAIVGDPDHCLGRLQTLANLGVDRFVISHATPDQPEHEEMRSRLVRDILPTMQGR